MATLIILINLVIASLFGGDSVQVNRNGSQTATISGRSVTNSFKTINITIEKNNPIILESEY